MNDTIGVLHPHLKDVLTNVLIQYLSPMDICRLGSTCTRLREYYKTNKEVIRWRHKVALDGISRFWCMYDAIKEGQVHLCQLFVHPNADYEWVLQTAVREGRVGVCEYAMQHGIALIRITQWHDPFAAFSQTTPYIRDDELDYVFWFTTLSIDGNSQSQMLSAMNTDIIKSFVKR